MREHRGLGYQTHRNLSRGVSVDAPGANTDLLPSGSATIPFDGIGRVTIMLATGSVVNVMVNDGSNEVAVPLNDNGAITAGLKFVEDVPGLKEGDVVDLQVETDGAITYVSLDLVL